MTLESVAARLNVTTEELEAHLSAIMPIMARLMGEGMDPEAAMAAAFAERQATIREVLDGKTARAKAVRTKILDDVYASCRAA